MDEHGLELLLEVFKTDSDITACTKALGAISGLIRHNKPGIAAFRLANGLAELRDAANTDNVKFQSYIDVMKAMFLMQYLLHEDKADCDAATKLGLHRLFIQLAASDDADVREAALESLLELTRGGKTQAAGLSEEDGKLKHVLQDRIKKIGQMSKDELGAVREERHLIDSLWKTCYNEPSLESDGLLYLPGDDDLPPDVASKFFEPPSRAWAAPRPDNTSNTASEKQEQLVLLLGAGPTSSADHRNEAAELLLAEKHNSGSS